MLVPQSLEESIFRSLYLRVYFVPWSIIMGGTDIFGFLLSAIGVFQALWVIPMSRFYNLMGVTTWIFIGHITIEVLLYLHYPTS